MGQTIVSSRAFNMKHLLLEFLIIINFFHIQSEIAYIEVKYPLKVG
jgi:hypothetical protein